LELEAEQIEQAMLFAHARCIRSADVHHEDAIAHNVNQCVALGNQCGAVRRRCSMSGQGRAAKKIVTHDD